MTLAAAAGKAWRPTQWAAVLTTVNIAFLSLTVMVVAVRHSLRLRSLPA
jgi:hypothetical protein